MNSWARSGIVCLEGSSTVIPCLSWGPSAPLLLESMVGGNTKAHGGRVNLRHGRFPVTDIVLSSPRG